jgi:hypothetical protein
LQEFLFDTIDFILLNKVALIAIKTLSTDLADNFGVCSLSLLGPDVRHVLAACNIAKFEVLTSYLGI